MVLCDLIPPPSYYDLVTFRTISILRFRSRDIAYIDIFHARSKSDLPCFIQGLYRCRRQMRQLVHGSEPGEMQGIILELVENVDAPNRLMCFAANAIEMTKWSNRPDMFVIHSGNGPRSRMRVPSGRLV